MPSSRTLTALLTLASAGMILAAWGFQFLGYPPCKMCYWQRYPHIAVIAIGLIAWLSGIRLFAWLGALAMAITSGIGVFHSGVERKLWAGPTSCSGGSVDQLDAEALLNQIMSAPLVRCDEIPWQLMGLTMANLNAIGSAIFAVLWIRVALSR